MIFYRDRSLLRFLLGLLGFAAWLTLLASMPRCLAGGSCDSNKVPAQPLTLGLELKRGLGHQVEAARGFC